MRFGLVPECGTRWSSLPRQEGLRGETEAPTSAFSDGMASLVYFDNICLRLVKIGDNVVLKMQTCSFMTSEPIAQTSMTAVYFFSVNIVFCTASSCRHCLCNMRLVVYSIHLCIFCQCNTRSEEPELNGRKTRWTLVLNHILNVTEVPGVNPHVHRENMQTSHGKERSLLLSDWSTSH